MKKHLAVAILSLASLSAWAERADSLKQAVINFDTLDVDEVNQTRILTGNVVLTRGTLTLKSDKAVLKESPEGYMSVTLTANPGKTASFRQKRDGGPEMWVEGQAQRIPHCRCNLGRRAYRGQPDPHHAICEYAGKAGRNFECQTRLADAARPQ